MSEIIYYLSSQKSEFVELINDVDKYKPKDEDDFLH
jgi:hypothetical protein